MERIIADMVARTDRSRFETHILALSYLGQFAEGLEQFATLRVARRMSPLSLLRPAALAADMRRIAPDLVHIHSGVWYKAVRAANVAGVRSRVYTDHGRQHPDPWTHRAIDRRASARTDRIVAVSAALRDHMVGFVADPARVMIIRNGVDTDRFRPRTPDGSLRAELGLSPETAIIGSVGRFEPVKGYEVSIAAFAKLLTEWNRTPAPALMLIGDGGERQRLEHDARALGIADRVFFRGWRTDLDRHLATFDLFAMSSHSEGTSVSLLEAMSSGLCPVVTRVGGNAAALGNSLAHRLVAPNDASALAAAWRDALDDGEARRRDGDAARQMVVDDYSLDAMVREYEAVYEELALANLPG